jgi:hypothetical protein
MIIKGNAENKESGIRIEMELFWTSMTESRSSFVGKTRYFNKEEWVRTDCHLSPELAVINWREMVEKHKLTIIKYEEIGSIKEETERLNKSIQDYIKGNNVQQEVRA